MAQYLLYLVRTRVQVDEEGLSGSFGAGGGGGSVVTSGSWVTLRGAAVGVEIVRVLVGTTLRGGVGVNGMDRGVW